MKRPTWQNLPLFKFSKKWIISHLTGSSPEVRGCLLTWAGISLKTAQSNCTFEVTHITDSTDNIAPTGVRTLLPSFLLFRFFLFLFPCDENYIICHKCFIKRGQPSINLAITHAITLIIPLRLICIIFYRTFSPQEKCTSLLLSGSAFSFNSELLISCRQCSLGAIVTDKCH